VYYEGWIWGEAGMPVETADIEKSSVKHRRTYHIQDELHEKVKAYAYWERIGISDVVNMSLDRFFESVEVKGIPEKRDCP